MGWLRDAGRAAWDVSMQATRRASGASGRLRLWLCLARAAQPRPATGCRPVPWLVADRLAGQGRQTSDVDARRTRYLARPSRCARPVGRPRAVGPPPTAVPRWLHARARGAVARVAAPRLPAREVAGTDPPPARVATNPPAPRAAARRAPGISLAAAALSLCLARCRAMRAPGTPGPRRAYSHMYEGPGGGAAAGTVRARAEDDGRDMEVVPGGRDARHGAARACH